MLIRLTLLFLGICTWGQAQRESTYFDIREALKHKDEVVRLDLSYKKLNSFPKEILQLKNLKRLNLSHNNITAIPPQISGLADLRRINLSHNKIESLPIQLFELKKLKKLYLDHNKLKSIPPEILQLTELKGLDVQYNPITSLPHQINKLSRLTFFRSDPLALYTLDSLRKLNASNWSFIRTVPDSIAGKPLLYYLNLTEISSFHKDLIRGKYPIQHEQANLSHIERLKDGSVDYIKFCAYLHRNLFLPWHIDEIIRERIKALVLHSFENDPKRYLLLYKHWIRYVDREKMTPHVLRNNYKPLFEKKSQWIEFYNAHVEKNERLAIVSCEFEEEIKNYESYKVYFYNSEGKFIDDHYINAYTAAECTASEDLDVSFRLVKYDLFDAYNLWELNDSLFEKIIIDSTLYMGRSKRDRIEDNATVYIPFNSYQDTSEKLYEIPELHYDSPFDEAHYTSYQAKRDSCHKYNGFSKKEKLELYRNLVMKPSNGKQLCDENRRFILELDSFLSDTSKEAYDPLGAPIFPMFKLGHRDAGQHAGMMLLDHYDNWSEEINDSTSEYFYRHWLNTIFTIYSAQKYVRKVAQIKTFNDYQDACFIHDCFQLYSMEDDTIEPLFAFPYAVSLDFDFDKLDLNKQLAIQYNCSHNSYYCDRGESPIIHSKIKDTDNLYLGYSDGYYPGRGVYLKLQNNQLIELWFFNIENVECSCI
jgi:hypothetical protein